MQEALDQHPFPEVCFSLSQMITYAVATSLQGQLDRFVEYPLEQEVKVLLKIEDGTEGRSHDQQ